MKTNQEKLTAYEKVSLVVVISTLALLLSGPRVLAETTSTEQKTTDQKVESSGKIVKEAEKELANQGDEADQLITNRLMRANAGSLSKWSVRTFWSYRGGSISNPFSVTRPNITGDGTVPALHRMTGDVGVRYRLDAKNALSASMGLSMASPFHYGAQIANARTQSEYYKTAHVLNANDPTIGYQHLDKVMGFQSSTTASFSLLTSNFSRQIAGMYTSSNASQQFMYEFEGTGFTLGSSFSATMYTFGGDVDSSMRPQFFFGIYPQAEYVINDTFNLRTVTGLMQLQVARNGDVEDLTVYQSVGLGISVTRDIFLYPNVQFIPSKLQANNTNVAINANVNLF